MAAPGKVETSEYMVGNCGDVPSNTNILEPEKQEDQKKNPNPMEIDVFDEDILSIVDSDDDALHIGFIDRFKLKLTPCYTKTKFHNYFSDYIKNMRNFGEESVFISGIEGIGKTSSVIYYVLDCIKRKDYRVHYVDLNLVVDNLDIFLEYAKENVHEGHCLILDHITVFNIHCVQTIRNTIKSVKYLQIESGFTASVHRDCMLFGKDYQLDREDFKTLWITSLRSVTDQVETRVQDLIAKSMEVYTCFAEHFIITPRLVQFVWREMYFCGFEADDVLMTYEKKIQDSIKSFSEIQDDNKLFADFILHTRMFLYFVPKYEDFILTDNQYRQVKIAVNIFQVKAYKVTKDDLRCDIRFTDLDLKEGERYVRLTHLIPRLALYWKERLPYRFDSVLDYVDSARLISIMFQNGGAHKEIENMIVKYQKSANIAIIPGSKELLQTTYSESSSEFKIPQSVGLSFLRVDDFHCINLAALKSFDTEYTYQDENVAKCALWIKRHMKENPFLLHVEVGNLMGVDYFVYNPYDKCATSQEWSCSAAKSPRLSHEGVLYLVQVASGASHRGDTIGRAFNIVKDVLSEKNIIIHVVVLVSSRSAEPYTLTKCRFENASVINLNNVKLLETFSQTGDNQLIKCRLLNVFQFW